MSACTIPHKGPSVSRSGLTPHSRSTMLLHIYSTSQFNTIIWGGLSDNRSSKPNLWSDSPQTPSWHIASHKRAVFFDSFLTTTRDSTTGGSRPAEAISPVTQKGWVACTVTQKKFNQDESGLHRRSCPVAGSSDWKSRGESWSLLSFKIYSGPRSSWIVSPTAYQWWCSYCT